MTTYQAVVRGPWGPAGTEVEHEDVVTKEGESRSSEEWQWTWHVNHGHLVATELLDAIPTDYSSQTVAELREEIARRESLGRDIEVHEPGNKAEIIEALEEDDANRNTGVVAPYQHGSPVPPPKE